MKVSPQTAEPAPDVSGSRQLVSEQGSEYEVVRLKFESLVVAYGCFLLLFVWFRVYWTFIRESWMWALAGGALIVAIGSLNAYRAWRKTRTFPALIALLLNGGMLISILLPMAAFFAIIYRVFY